MISTSELSVHTKTVPAEKELPADQSTVSRSLIPAGTATLRDFSYVAPEIPELTLRENCTGCMDCVTLCPGHGDPRQSRWRKATWTSELTRRNRDQKKIASFFKTGQWSEAAQVL